MELVSVIIPLCNKSAYIEETVRSVKNQSWPSIEIIIIENNSSDQSYENAKKLACSNVRVIKSLKKGASAARNLGLKVAKGKFIQFLDADDLLSPSKIEKQIMALNDEYSLAFANWARFTNHFNERENYKREIHLNELSIFKPKDFLEKQYMVPVHAWLCTRSLINRIGYWNENLTVNDDGDYFIRVIKECSQVIYVPELTYYRSDTTFSLSKSKDMKAYESIYASILTYKNIISHYNSPILDKVALEKFGNLFLEVHNKHKVIEKLCKKELNNNYKYCYSSLRISSQIIAYVLGIRSYLAAKQLLRKIPFLSAVVYK